MKNKKLGFLASDGTVKSWGDVKQRLFKGSVQNYFTRSMTAENLNHGAQMLLLFQSWFFSWSSAPCSLISLTDQTVVCISKCGFFCVLRSPCCVLSVYRSHVVDTMLCLFKGLSCFISSETWAEWTKSLSPKRKQQNISYMTRIIGQISPEGICCKINVRSCRRTSEWQGVLKHLHYMKHSCRRAHWKRIN